MHGLTWPAPGGSLGAGSGTRTDTPRNYQDLLVSVLFWLAVALYAVTFCAISLRRYDAFLMHSLDMGNMEQAAWNTLHGHPFRFTNMRQHIAVEAFGTDTRLSFHVEPIFLPLSLLLLLYSGPQTLLIAQTLILASGAVPARRLARRHLPGSRPAEVVFPLAYLLFPALQAANLYEFHPVTLTAALLLWAFDGADEGRAAVFVPSGLAALCCKEEIGLTVALIALWGLRGRLPGRVAWPMALACTAWAVSAVLLIIPAAQKAQHSVASSSPYLSRYLDRALTIPSRYRQITIGTLLRYWVDHPERLGAVLVGPTKLGFLHRLFVPGAYLSLLSPFALAIGLPSAALIMLSNDQHMYGGLGHYTAELVPIVIAAAILGLGAAARLARRLHGGSRVVVAAGLTVLFVLSAWNTRLNGFAPFSNSFEWPALTPHVRLGERMLVLIPPDAPVSATDLLDPHLSARSGIYLFPDVADARYVAIDVSASPIPLGPLSLQRHVVSLLRSRQWDVLFADDGYLLLRRRATPAPAAPVLPMAFYRFALAGHESPALLLRGSAGGLQLLGYRIDRREVVNLRVPDVVLTTYWRVTSRLRSPLLMRTYLTDVRDHVANYFNDQAALAWLPISSWQPGQVMKVTSTSMGVGSTDPGIVHACMSVDLPPARPGNARRRLPFRMLTPPRADQPYQLLGGGAILCVGSVPVRF